MISKWGPAAVVGWGGLGLVVLLGSVSGMGGAIMAGSLYALGVAVFALLRGHVTWARITSRRSAALALVASFAAMTVGAANAQPSAQPDTTIVAVDKQARAKVLAPPSASVSSPSESPVPATTSSPSSTSLASTGAPQPAAASPSTAAAARPAAAASGTALAALATLSVKGRAPKTGYDRALFGQAWFDADRNGCDTRNDILRRDLKPFTLKAGTNGCLVLSGTLNDPYTAKKIAFVRGQGTSTKVQIDHVVALSDAWQKGAQQLGSGTRTAFANDPLNLLAVDGPTNQAKGDGDAATWLPPNKTFRCAYVARQIAVKKKYGLWVTHAEHDAMARILAGCPGQKLPIAGAIALGGGTVVAAAPAPASKPSTATKPKALASTAPKPAPKPGSGTDRRFATCKAAKAAGFGPYYKGKDPEYAWYRDADHDGIVCE